MDSKIIFLLFYVKKDGDSVELNNKNLLSSHKYLKKDLAKIIYAQKKLQRMYLIKKIFLSEVLKLKKK